jgi:hypothetical protein
MLASMVISRSYPIFPSLLIYFMAHQEKIIICFQATPYQKDGKFWSGLELFIWIQKIMKTHKTLIRQDGM